MQILNDTSYDEHFHLYDILEKQYREQTPVRVSNGVQSEWPGKFKSARPTVLSDMQDDQGTGNNRCYQWLVKHSVCPDTVACLPTVGDSSQCSNSGHANFMQGHLSRVVFIVSVGQCRGRSYSGNSMWYAIMLTVAYKLSLCYILSQLAKAVWAKVVNHNDDLHISQPPPPGFPC